MSAGPGTREKPRRQSPVQGGALGWGALTLCEAVPGVDVAVVHVHDVHALVAHEVAFMPVALGGGHTEATHGRPVPGARPGPPSTPQETPLCWAGGGAAWGSAVLLGAGNPTTWGHVSEAAWGVGTQPRRALT